MIYIYTYTEELWLQVYSPPLSHKLPEKLANGVTCQCFGRHL